jgi:hypothetical protein
MSRKADKAHYLKRLFDQQLVYTLPESSPAQRQDQAAQLMDELVGPRWRTEVNAEMELIPDLEEFPNSQDVEEFWGRVQWVGDKSGFREEVLHDEPQDQPDPPKCEVEKSDPKKISLIKKLLGFM